MTKINNVEQVPPNHGPLLFLHGGGLNREMWRPQLEYFQEHRPAFAIDLPGHGDQQHIPFTLDTATQCISNAIATHGSGSPMTVVGLSLGGYAAIVHAAKIPNQVRALVLSGCCVPYFGFLKYVAHANVRLSNLITQRWFESLQRRMVKAVAPPTICEHIARAGFSCIGAQDGMRSVIGVDFSAMLTQCTIPTLILNGERDGLNRKYEQSYQNASDNATVGVVRNAGHLCSLEQPRSFSEAVRTFAEKY